MSDAQPRLSVETVVTTHLNADFDAMASALAATKLYPDARVVLPGSQEKGVRDFLSEFPAQLFESVRLKDLDLDGVRHLIVVDTRQRSRIGAFAALLDRPEVKVTVYDHHPEAGDDIEGGEVIHRFVGANTTVMVDLLRERGIPLTSEEATFLALGVYEDTGSFTFVSTTPQDLRAMAWLLEQGADLKKVAEVATSRLRPEHVDLLSHLLHTAETYTLSGIPITVAKTSTPEYVEDFAVLAHELMDMEKLTVLFVLVLMADHVLVVARSRDPRVDVGEILRPLGGGGHPLAASANLKGLTLAEAEERLLAVIHKRYGREPRVGDVMSRPVLSVEPETPLTEVHDRLTLYGITVLPVVRDGVMLGLISRRIVEKAIYHGLGDLPVQEYMTTDFDVVRPEDPFDRLKEVIVERRQRFVPVVAEGRVVGVITRTDLLQILTGDPTRQPEPLLAKREQRKNVAAVLREMLSEEMMEVISTAGEVGDRLGFQVYVVGGFVRDLLLREPNLDVDLVIEGDGISFAEALGERFGARVRVHRKFGTAVVIFPNGFKVDVATARWEYYEYPAAMPTVALSSIKLDLYRRDFTVNTLAIKLNPHELGTLIDFFGGQKDLKDRTIRVLHSLSFVEDPTRVFRAVRFEQRYGFTIGKHTLRLIQNALQLKIFAKLSGKRLLTELKLILNEADPRPALRRLAGLGLFQVIHPGLHMTPPLDERLGQAYEALTWYDLLFRKRVPKNWLVYLVVLVAGLDAPERAEVAERLGLTGKFKDLVVDGPDTVKELLRFLFLKKKAKASEIFHRLALLPVELLLVAIAVASDERAKQALSRFITELQDVRPLLRGTDLKVLGFPPGPLYKKILNRLLEARLNGLVAEKDDEVALVQREFGKSRT